MSMIKRLFGSPKRAGPDAAPHAVPERPAQIDPTPDSRLFLMESNQAATRRELARVMTRDTLRAAGVPDGWVESQVLLELGRNNEAHLHLRLVVKHWDVRLLKYAVALQNRLVGEIARLDPAARDWLLSVAWQYEVGEACPFQELPEPADWQGAAQSSVHAALQPREPAAPAPAVVRPAAPPAPAPAAAPQMTEVDLPLDLEEPDDVSQDLARLFAIRDANMPGTSRH